MLLSYGKPVEVSSTDSIHAASNLTDESMRTYWAARSGNPGEWAGIDLGSTKNVRAVQLNFYDHKAVQYNRAMDIYHQYRIFASEDGKEWTLVIDKSDSDKDCPHDYIELNEPLRARYLKYENVHMPTGNVALSGFRVFGNGDGDVPQAVKGLTVKRDRKDRRNALISWQPKQAPMATTSTTAPPKARCTMPSRYWDRRNMTSADWMRTRTITSLSRR